MKKIKTSRLSKTPPLGWPSDKQWKKIEKKLEKKLGSKLLSVDAGPIETTKHEICTHFVRFFNNTKINQKEMASLLEVSESRVSEILNYHYERFTIDKLLDLLVKINPEVKLKVA